LLHKDDSAKTNGFYNHSNVIRIECELSGVGTCPVLRFWSFEGERPRDSNRCNVTVIMKTSV